MTTEKEMQLVPLRGKSGQAYMGVYPDGEKIFVKYNTTPIIAALAKEQIAPQLLWSKRTINGDTMIAQQWLDGRLLERQDMNSKQIVQIMMRLHQSKNLVNQLLQLNYRIENPFDLIRSWEQEAPKQLQDNSYLQSIVTELKKNLPDFNAEKATIVHGDVRHTNWVITTSGMIYLVDWDTVRLSDRMYDVAHLVSHYIPQRHWKDWMSYYGFKDNDLVMSKFYWYGQLSYLRQILTFFDLKQMDKVNQEIYDLRRFRASIQD